jgi:enoyl-[acyl-carrier protein] reductase I
LQEGARSPYNEDVYPVATKRKRRVLAFCLHLHLAPNPNGRDIPVRPTRSHFFLPFALLMLSLDLSGRRALVAGVADDAGYGFAIARALAEAGASVCVATWPPALNIFLNLIERGKIDEARRLPDGSLLAFERIYPLDAVFDTLSDAPQELRESKRYRDVGDFSIDGLAARLVADFGERPLDIVVHSLANGPEVKKALIETSRAGYLAAISASAYSMVSLVQRLAPLLRAGGSALSLTYLASERVIPGYGGGMSSAKAALESDTRVLAYEAGRAHGIRVNTISAGPLASRAASAIGIIDRMVDYCRANSPLPEALSARDVATAAAFLVSPLASGISGTTVYVDKGYHAMGMAVASLDAEDAR